MFLIQFNFHMKHIARAKPDDFSIPSSIRVIIYSIFLIYKKVPAVIILHSSAHRCVTLKAFQVNTDVKVVTKISCHQLPRIDAFPTPAVCNSSPQ
jgi:hypothetical protein